MPRATQLNATTIIIAPYSKFFLVVNIRWAFMADLFCSAVQRTEARAKENYGSSNIERENPLCTAGTALIRTLSGSFTAAWHDDCDEMNNLSKCYD